MLELDPAPRPELGREVYRGDDALELLADPAWTELVLRQPRPNPTLLGGWQRALGDLRLGEPLVVTVSEDGRLVAGGSFAVREALGGRLSYATWLGGSFQPFSPDVMTNSPAATDALLDELLGRVDLVKLIAVQHGSLADAVRRCTPWGSITRAPSGTYVSYLPLPTRARLLRDAARDERRAARKGVQVHVRVATEPDEVARALERLFRLHRERWAGRPDENANFARSAATRAFHRAAVAALAEEGRVRMIEVTEDGRLVASNLSLVAGRGGLAYVMARRQGHGMQSPGYRVVVALSEQLLADGCEVVDIGGGSLSPTSPKGRLVPVSHPFAQIVVASSRRLQRVTDLALRGRSGVKAAPLRGVAAAAVSLAAVWAPSLAAQNAGGTLHGSG